MANLQGLNKRLNSRFENLGLADRVKEFVINTVRDVVVDALKSDWVADHIAAAISEAATAAGITLNLTNIKDKDATKSDVDAAVTAKINELAGTQFQSLRLINRESLQLEIGRAIGEKLGIGSLYPVAAFRDAVGVQLVQAFEGQGNALFSAGVVQAVETKVVGGWRELTTKAQTYGNPMNAAGPPRDAAHAAQRAANRLRQAKYRRKNAQKWVPLGYAAGDAGNGREGLTGKASGNTKTVQNSGLDARKEGYQYY